MSVPVITFFNHKGGVGKTSLVYHLSWMLAERGHHVLAVDLDPQANLTAAFLEQDRIESLWFDDSCANTIYRAIEPLTGVGDLRQPTLVPITERLNLLPGDVDLAGFEDALSGVWPDSMGDRNLYRPFRILSAFWQVAQMAAEQTQATIILADVGPNLGAINRSALLASDNVVIPLGADLFSLQGLKNLGPTLRSWRSLWQKRLDNWSQPAFALPQGAMQPVGYLLQQPSIRLNRPVTAYDRWVKRIPAVYHRSVLNESGDTPVPDPDPQCLAILKHYRSLVPMAQEARKPIFKLTPADGAIGNHAAAVKGAYMDFQALAVELLRRVAVPLPSGRG